MCWNAEVSLQSFLIGITSVALAYQKNLPLATTVFCLTIVFMQLVEFFVWTFYNNPTVNFTASLAAAFLLWLQPIASIMTLQSWKPFLAIYLLLSIVLQFFDSTPLRENYKMKRGESGHLVWNWLQKDTQTTVSLLVYFVFLFVPLLISRQFTLLALSVSTLGISLYSFYKDNTWGSMWCWLVNYLVVGVSFKQILITKP